MNQSIAIAIALLSTLGAVADTVVIPSPIVRVATSPLVGPELRGACIEVRLDRASAQALAAVETAILADFPLTATESATVAAYRVLPFSPDAEIILAHLDDKGAVVEAQVPLPNLNCFAGVINGDPQSRFLLSIGERVCLGYAEIDGRTFVLSNGPLPAPADAPLLVTEIDALPAGAIDWRQWACETPDENAPAPQEGGLAGAQPCRQVKIAIESDYEYLQLFQGDVLAAVEYTATLFAATQDIYINSVNARTWMSLLRLWPLPNDPWSASSTSGELYAFRDYWQSNMGGTLRHLAHFVSGRSLGGGVAWLNAICSPNEGYGLSANIGGFFPYPLLHNHAQNWDIMVFAHELGHNFGSPHTHSESPPADGCGSSPQDCSAATAGLGTIMSYCHLCTGGMANMRMEFHPASIASIEAYLPQVSCILDGGPAGPTAVPDWASVNQGAAVDIDVLLNDARTTCDPVTINSFPAGTIHGAVMTRVVGGGPGGRDLIRYTSAAGWFGVDTFSYVVRDSGGAIASTIVSVWISPLSPASNPFGDLPGLGVKYFELISPTILPDFPTLTPYLISTAATINYQDSSGAFADSGRNNNVGARYTGWLNVPASASYTLYTESNEGSRLRIDGALVVDNDGLHAMLEKSGVKQLAVGKHALVLDFFEATGSAGCIMRIEGGGLAKQFVPAGMLTSGGSMTFADFDGDAQVTGVDLAIFLGRWGSTDALADMDDNGVVDGGDLALLLGNWTG
ncbi:MAG: hypothetical protein EXS00_05315 [Phycisphaerales bacterium]|nr:hypothetical protein [Phycisphaerales bacterium]